MEEKLHGPEFDEAFSFYAKIEDAGVLPDHTMGRPSWTAPFGFQNSFADILMLDF